MFLEKYEGVPDIILDYKLMSEYGRPVNKNKLSLSYDTTIRLTGAVYVLLKITEYLFLFGCIGLTNILKDLDNNEGFVELEYLELYRCNEMEYLLDTVDGAPQRVAAFPNLKLLVLSSLRNFSEICHGQLPPKSFSNVQELGVRRCYSMSTIVPSNLLSRLQDLQTISASHCDSLLNVFDLAGLAIVEEDTKLLSRLEKLALQLLPALMHVWKGSNSSVNLHNLRDVNVRGCTKLSQLFPPALVQGLVRLEELRVEGCINMTEIFGTRNEERMDQTTVVGKSLRADTSLKNLARVTVYTCDRLRNIFSSFSSSIAKGLSRLTTLDIQSCEMMKAIVELESDQEKGEAKASSVEDFIVFPCLSRITLINMGNLTCFCTCHNTVKFPSLEEMLIESCPKMETFGHGDVMTPNLNRIKVDGAEEIWKDGLNATVQHIFKREREKNPEQAEQSPLS